MLNDEQVWKSVADSTDIVQTQWIPGSGMLKEFPDFNTHETLHITECSEMMALSRINFINGDLIISDSETEHTSPLLKLLPLANDELIDILPNLYGINGSLYIVGTKYRKITGFTNLAFITGSIIIMNNQYLEQVPSFSHLLNIGNHVHDVEERSEKQVGAFILAHNASLLEFRGLNMIRQIADGLFIMHHAKLHTLHLADRLYHTSRIVISYNACLSLLCGFNAVTMINKDIIIMHNNAMHHNDLIFQMLRSLESVRHIWIINNVSLTQICWPQLHRAASITICANKQLECICTSLYTVEEIFIESNKMLHDIRMDQLKEVMRSLIIVNNDGLKVLNTFDHLTRIGGGLIIAYNHHLTCLRGFNALHYVGSDTVSNLPQSEHSIFDLKLRANHVRVLRSKTLHDHFNPSHFEARFIIKEFRLSAEFFHTRSDLINYSIIITNNARLKCIHAFSLVRYLNDTLFISHHAALQTIQAFDDLIFLLDVQIHDNCELKSIIGFEKLCLLRQFILKNTSELITLKGLGEWSLAQYIKTETKNAQVIDVNHIIPTVLGYNTYHTYAHL